MEISPGQMMYPLMSGIAGVAGLIFLFRSMLELRLAIESLSWKRVKAIVLEAYIDEDEDGDGDRGYVPKLQYEFAYRGRNFFSEQLSYRNNWFGRYSTATRLLRGKYKGTEIDAYVDPKDPGRSVIIPGPDVWSYLQPLLLALFLGLVFREYLLHLSA